MTLNDWYSVFQLGSVVTLFLAFAFGTGAVLSGLRITKESQRQTLELQNGVAYAKLETAHIKADADRSKQESDEKIAALEKDSASYHLKTEELTQKNLELSRELEEERVGNAR